MRAVSKAYGWPNYYTSIKKLSPTISQVNDSYVGKYQQGNDSSSCIFATFEDVKVPFPLYQEGDCLYFAEETAKRIQFVKNDAGQIAQIHVSYYSQPPTTYQ